jgi:hypothetical protein
MSANRNRTAGHGWERDLVKCFHDLGFPHVVTSRSESRARDAQGIDLVNKDERFHGQFPFNIQAKNMIGHVKYAKLLEALPREKGVLNVVIHKQTEKQGTRFKTQGTYAILPLTDFFTLISVIQRAGIILTPALLSSLANGIQDSETNDRS